MNDLYVEGRIAFIEFPTLRLFTRDNPMIRAVELHAEGRVGGFALETPCFIAVWKELLMEEPDFARIAAEEFRAHVVRAYNDSSLRRRRIRV